MKEVHHLLARQLKRHFGQWLNLPVQWQEFIQAVDEAYRQFDADRGDLENSLKMSSQELLSANSAVQAIFQAIPDLLFCLDNDGTILDFRAGASVDLMLQRQAFIGKKIQSIPVKSVAEQFRRAIELVAGHRSMVNIEYALELQKQQCHYEARFVPLRDNQIVAIIRNVTERKLAEDELRRTVSVLRSIIESTADGILVVNSAGKIVIANERFARMWRIPQELIDAGDDQAMLACVTSQLNDPESFRRKVMELYGSPLAESHDGLEFADGRTFERFSCPQILDGHAVGRVWTFRNVTKQKRAEASLLKMSLAIEQTADSVLITDSDGTIEYVNPAFEAMTGYSQPELLGQNPRVLKSGQHPEAFYAEMWNVILSGRVYSGSVVNRCKNGKLVYVEKTITPIKDRNGKITNFISTDKDITERRELELQLRQSQKMEAFGQLAAGVAHDFNNMLTAILGNTTLLEISDGLNAEQSTSVSEISNAANRAANLTRQLLTFSRRQPIQRKDVDLNEVVVNMTKMLQRLIGEHIALEARYAPGGAFVHADPGMMEQLVMNLAVNSRDAMPRGGSLAVQTSLVNVDDAHIKSNTQARTGSFVRLSISDTGCGIPPENLPKIFEPFFTTKEVGKGTGLGLATVFGIVNQHGGWIEVESELNIGTTFHIYLPKRDTSGTARIKKSPTRNIRGGTETILLVEDDNSLRTFLQRVLAGKGYEVLAADSGVAALEVWEKHQAKISLLITDMVMPKGMSGRQLAEQLAKDKPSLKVIYCSGYTDDMLGEDSPLRNNPNFLEKPFVPEKLLQRVRNLLDEN